MFKQKLNDKICLEILEEICQKYEMEYYCSIGIPCKDRICICKSDKIWEVFLIENGRKYLETKHKECIDACIQLLKHCSYTNEEFEIVVNEFKNILQKKKETKILKKCKLKTNINKK